MSIMITFAIYLCKKEYMRDTLEELRDLFANIPCRDEVYCALFYGSVATKLPFPSADLDLHIVLKKRNTDCLKQIKQKLNDPKVNFDVSIHYLDEVRSIRESPELFQNGTQGCHFSYTLAKAQVIIGVNPYIKLARKVSHSQVKASFLRKALEYQWKIRNSFFRNGDKNVFMFKYFRRMLLVIGIIIGKIRVGDFDYHYVQEDFVSTKIDILSRSLGLQNHPAVKALHEKEYTLKLVEKNYVELLDFVNSIKIQKLR